MKQWMKSAMLCTAVVFSQPLWAGDAGLYGAVAPANSAFFRTFNADSNSVSVVFKGKTFSLQGGEVSTYAFTESGEYDVDFNGYKQHLSLKNNQQETLVWDGKKVVVLAEQPLTTKAKARLALYNFSSASASLATTAGISVIGPVSTGTYLSRDVNAVQAAFLVKSDNGNPVTTPSILLKRGQTTSLFFYKAGGQNVVSVLEANR